MLYKRKWVSEIAKHRNYSRELMRAPWVITETVRRWKRSTVVSGERSTGMKDEGAARPRDIKELAEFITSLVDYLMGIFARQHVYLADAIKNPRNQFEAAVVSLAKALLPPDRLERLVRCRETLWQTLEDIKYHLSTKLQELHQQIKERDRERNPKQDYQEHPLFKNFGFLSEFCKIITAVLQQCNKREAVAALRQF